MKEKVDCKGLTFEDCELAILRMAVDKAEEKMGKRIVNSEDIKNINLTFSNIVVEIKQFQHGHVEFFIHKP